jgi:hypothetical protein
MSNKIIIQGKILFDPEDKTKKHAKQASWKKVVMFEIGGDLSELHGWFIKKRFNLSLNRPLRKAHMTVVNDKIDTIKNIKQWETIKEQYNGKTVDIEMDLDRIRTDGKHWWICAESNEAVMTRRMLGLSDRPYFGYHITIGHANEKNIEHSRYLHRLIKKGYIK